MALRLSDFCRDRVLSPLSLAASRPHATGRRSRFDSVGAVSDHKAKLPAQILARHLRPDRLCAAQGAVSQRAWRAVMAAQAARRALLEQARPADGVQYPVLRRPRAGGRMVGLSAVVAAAAADLDDGD